MSENRPQNNRNIKKTGYKGVPVKRKPAPRPPIKSSSGGRNAPKYNIPKSQRVPKAVIVTNILMICVILSICGLVFAIVFNNIQYDKADAERRSSLQSTEHSVSTSAPQSTSTSDPAAGSVTSGESSAADSQSAAQSSEPSVTPLGNFDKEFFDNDLFIGDSIFTGLYLYGYLDQKNVAAKTGYTAYGAQVNTFDETIYSGSAVDYAKMLQPKHIIIMLGSNSLSPQTDFEDFENGYRGLINTLKTNCPESTILLISVPPVTADSSMASYSGVTNGIIDTANTRLKALCSELKIQYYDLNSVFKDESGNFNKDYAEVDGMHFLGTTYPVLLSGVESVLKQD